MVLFSVVSVDCSKLLLYIQYTAEIDLPGICFERCTVVKKYVSWRCWCRTTNELLTI
jgi:hypothetical protein